MDSVCTWIDREDVFEDYVRGSLPHDVRDAFEAHLFECEACFDQVETYGALAAELPTVPRAEPIVVGNPDRAAWWKWRWAALAAAATIVAATGVGLWPRRPPAPKPVATVATAPTIAPETPSPAPAPPVSSTAAPAPAVPPATVGRSARSEVPSAATLDALAQVEAPIYLPVPLRGLHDEAADRFEDGMRQYLAKDYAGAIPDLRESVRLRPDAPNAAFFLAICQLLTSDVASAAEGLQKTIALGDSPYVEEAHFYLAKARLKQGDVAAARAELQRVVDHRGRLEREARRLLEQLR